MSHSHLPKLAGHLPTLAGKSGPFSYEVTAFFSPGSWYAGHRVCTLQELHSISPSLWNSCGQTSLAFKATLFGGLLLPLPGPQAGEPDIGLRTLSPGREILWYNCSPPTWKLWESPTWKLWDFYHSCVLPIVWPWLLCLGCRVSFCGRD